MTKKIDGVIEAARFKNGQIMVVRAYERRGATFSDRVVLDRKTLMERLKNGKQFVVGTREELRASTFKLGKPVRLMGQDVVSTRDGSSHDELEETPFF